MTPLAAAPAIDAFRTEVRKARHLGFRIQLRVDEGFPQHTAYAKLLPVTDKARARCRRAGAVAIEARQLFDRDPAQVTDALHSAILAALDHAESA
jgi:hypothetical protein